MWMRTFGVLLFLSTRSFAEDLTPETAATLRHEQEQADQRVAKQHGDKKPADMSKEERREYFREQSAAHRDVLSKHGVEDRDYARFEARMNASERDRAKAAEQTLSAQERQQAEKKAAESRQKPTEKETPVVVQHGVSPEDAAAFEGEGKEPAEPGPKRHRGR